MATLKIVVINVCTIVWLRFKYSTAIYSCGDLETRLFNYSRLGCVFKLSTVSSSLFNLELAG